MGTADATDHWTARLAELASSARVPGAALGVLADGQEIVVAYGVLSTATQVAVTPDSVFQVGSITKPWTATMIMQLIDEGRLSLDTTVAQVLPSIRLGKADIGALVTVRHLLTHTSGIDGDIFNDTGRGGDCVERYVAELADAVVTYPTGAAYSYCNSGFVLLGRMIEVLDNKEWDESLRHRLIEPLGLPNTMTLPEEAILRRAAVGHGDHSREFEPVSVWGLARALGPAGLITASAGDVLSFARLHLNGGVASDETRLLSASSAEAMQEPTYPIPGFGDYADSVGLSWRLNKWAGRPIYGHDGSTIGQTAYLRIDPEGGVVACLLTNAADSKQLYERLFTEVFERYSGLSVPAEPEPVTGPVESDISRHCGRYERTSHRFDVTLVDGHLYAVALVTGQLGALTDSEPEEFDLYPADSSGENFVCRSHERQPWSTLSFGALGDGTPYLYSGGRITLRVS